jgi:hypothetical protein
MRNESIPPLPAQIANNGQELWDWAGRASRAIQLQGDINRLTAEIARLKTKQCGSCAHWMHSGDCPREKSTMRGYNDGPNCVAPACGQFEWNFYMPDFIADREAELAELRSKFEPRP